MLARMGGKGTPLPWPLPDPRSLRPQTPGVRSLLHGPDPVPDCP